MIINIFFNIIHYENSYYNKWILRSFELNLENFVTNVIGNHDVDIYIHKMNDENQDRYNNTNNWDKIKKVLKPKLVIETK